MGSKHCDWGGGKVEEWGSTEMNNTLQHYVIENQKTKLVL